MNAFQVIMPSGTQMTVYTTEKTVFEAKHVDFRLDEFNHIVDCTIDVTENIRNEIKWLAEHSQLISQRIVDQNLVQHKAEKILQNKLKPVTSESLPDNRLVVPTFK